MGFMDKVDNLKDKNKSDDAGKEQSRQMSLANNMPGDEQAHEPMLDVSHPASSLQWGAAPPPAQISAAAPAPSVIGGSNLGGSASSPMGAPLPSYAEGGDVPKDQIAKVDQGERVLNPEEAHAYRAAAQGDEPPTILGRIASRAHELYNQGQALHQPLDNEAQSFQEKQHMVDQATAGNEPNDPPARMQPYMAAPSDHLHSMSTYGSRPGEKRLDPQGNVINPTTPQGMGAAKPQLPEPTALGRLRSFDDGGDVDADQVAKLHQDEHVLDPEKADAYRQAEAEVTQEHGAPADFGGAVLPNPKGLKVMGDAESPEPDYKLQGAKMSTQNAPPGTPSMDISNPPSFDAGNSPIQESSTLKSQGPAKMKPAYGMGAGGAQPETPVNPTEQIQPKTTHEDIDAAHQVKIDDAKSTAAANGNITALGHAQVLQNQLDKEKPAELRKLPGQTELPTPTAPSPEEGLKNQKDELHHKMLYAPTEQERFQAEKDLAELKRRTPWGSPENHPGFLGKLGHYASAIGQGVGQGIAPYAINAIPGSRADIERQANIGEQGVENAQKEQKQAADITIAQGKPELAQEAQRLAGEKNEIASEKNKMTTEANLRKSGYKTDPVSGNPVPLPYEEMSQHEQGVYDLNQAKATAQDSIAQLKKAQADPNSPQSKLILARIADMGKKLDIAGQKLGLDVDKYKADYLGLDHDNKPLPGVTTTEAGTPIGPKVAKGNEATSMRLNKADLSQNVQLNATNAIKMITDNPDLFGKVSGRFTNVAQMAGTGDEAIVKLGIEIHNMAVASAGIHGQKGQAAVEAYEKDILNKFHNSPEATISGIKELSGSVQTFIDDAKAGKKVAPTPKTEEEITKGIPKTATHTYKDKAGKIVGYAENGKYHALTDK